MLRERVHVGLRALRLLPADLPDVRALAGGDGHAARPHPADGREARRHRRLERRGRGALRPLPRLHGVPVELPVGRPLRPADRGDAARRGDEFTGRERSACSGACCSPRSPTRAGCAGRSGSPLSAARFRHPPGRRRCSTSPPAWRSRSQAPGGDAGRRRVARTGRPADRLCPAGAVRRRQRRHRTDARRGRATTSSPRRRDAAERSPRTRAGPTRPTGSPSGSATRSPASTAHRRQRLRLRLAPEGAVACRRSISPRRSSEGELPELHPLELTVAYQDSCHLRHAQRLPAAWRPLLERIPGLRVVEPAEQDICCGSAGIYNVTQPEAARALGDRKAAHVLATGAGRLRERQPGLPRPGGAGARPGGEPPPGLPPRGTARRVDARPRTGGPARRRPTLSGQGIRLRGELSLEPGLEVGDVIAASGLEVDREEDGRAARDRLHPAEEGHRHGRGGARPARPDAGRRRSLRVWLRQVGQPVVAAQLTARPARSVAAPRGGRRGEARGTASPRRTRSRSSPRLRAPPPALRRRGRRRRPTRKRRARSTR